MEWCGLALDEVRNAEAVGAESRISPDGARLPVFVVPANEERVIAEDTAACLAVLR